MNGRELRFDPQQSDVVTAAAEGGRLALVSHPDPDGAKNVWIAGLGA
jgi:hypothetical protein